MEPTRVSELSIRLQHHDRYRKAYGHYSRHRHHSMKLQYFQYESLVSGRLGSKAPRLPACQAVSLMHLRLTQTRTRVACLKACNVLAMMPLLKYTATEVRTVAIGKDFLERDTGYFTRVSCAPNSNRIQN